jgi:hypothetical protein
MIMMNCNSKHRSAAAIATKGVAFLFLLLLLSCGKEEKPIPTEETGEPNVVPVEMQMYREARSVFRTWVQLFQRPREAEPAYPLLSGSSRRKLSSMGITDADAFAQWVERETGSGRTPFSYEFSRFDILDIDVRDTNRAIVTASFLVHANQNTFESVSSFFLLREKGNWKVPFAEASNFETSWWQKEKNFFSRLREEGMTDFASDSLGLSFVYPMTWDISSGIPLAFPQRGTQRGIELRYIDPSSQVASAVIRIAVVPEGTGKSEQSQPAPPPHPSSAGSTDSPTSEGEEGLLLIETKAVQLEQPQPMRGTMYVYADPVSRQHILFLTLSDENITEVARYAQTFNTIRKSLLLKKEMNP